MSALPLLPRVQPLADQWSAADMDVHAQIGASVAPTLRPSGGIPMYRFAMRIAVLAAVAAALVLAPVTTASADPATVTRFDIDNLQFNTCNGELVLLSGTLTVVSQERDGETVAYTIGQFTGTGSFGTEYVLSYRTEFFLVSDPFSFEVTNTQLLVSKGSEPNQLATITVSFPPFDLTMEAVCHG